MLASLVGALFISASANAFLQRNLGFLVSFSAGVFAVIAYGLATEVLEHASSVGQGLLFIFLGAVGVWLLFKLLPTLHDHPERGSTHSHPLDARRVLISDSFHNVGDGILLAASFVAGPALGIAAAVSIFIHEMVQEVSEFFVLRAAGYSVRQALARNLLVSAAILPGAIGGYYFLELFESLEPVVLGLSAGAFLVVVLGDLIPHSVREARSSSHSLAHVVWFAVGMVLMFSLTQVFGHGNELVGGEHAHEEAAGLHEEEVAEHD